MLAELTPTESDRLWWRLVRAAAAVADEVDSLSLAPESIRDSLYGDHCLESYVAFGIELAGLAAELADSPLTRITVLRDNTPEEGSNQWQDSEVTATTPPPPKWRQWTATLAANCPGRNQAATLRQSARKCYRRSWTP
jgi:hypothetical protein